MYVTFKGIRYPLSDVEIIIDWGHGPGTPGKETPFIQQFGRKIQEEEFNIPTAKMLGEKLKKSGLKVFYTAAESYDVPLNTRIARANARTAKVRIFISIHFNAVAHTFDASTASGFSVHVQEGIPKTAEAYKLALIMSNELSKGTKQTNRGVVLQNLAVTRLTHMTAVLVECGFMDDPREALLMLDKAFQDEKSTELHDATLKFLRMPVQQTAPVKVTPVSASNRSYYQKDDIDPYVGIIQKNLNRLGEKLTVDNVYGTNTVDAVKRFQAAQKLEVDGVFGSASRARLESVIAALDSPAKPAAPKPAAVTIPKESIVAAVIAPKADPNKPDIWAAKEWDAAQGLKYFDGTRPRDPISRQEAAIVAMRQQDNFEKQLAALQKSLQK